MPDNELNKIEDISKHDFDDFEQPDDQVEKEDNFGPEKTVEQGKSFEEGRETVLREIEKSGSEEFVGGLAGVSNAQKERQEKIKEVEKILEEDMEEIFVSMPPNKQAEFKRLGEETTRKILGLLDRAKIKVSDVIKLVKKWLSIVPGINKFFLEQESKIKADEIIKIKENNK